MASSTFLKDRDRGHAGEQALVRALDGEPGLTARRLDGRKSDCELSINGRSVTAEVKTDYKHRRTGNLAVEIANPKSGLATGLYATEAELFVFVLKDEVWVAPTKTLRAAVEAGMAADRYRLFEGAGDGNATVALVPAAEVLGPLFVRLDNLSPGEKAHALQNLLT